MTPDRYEAEFSLQCGHTPSYAGSPPAALVGTQRALTRYQSPISGLHLSHAGPFAGAGISGAATRKTADLARCDRESAVARCLRPLRYRTAMIRSGAA